MASVVNTIITFIVSSFLGYCLNTIKNYKNKNKKEKENENLQNIALLTLIQTQLTNTYFVYEKFREIPDYVYKNWLNLFNIYEKLGGNDYCHMLKEKMGKWKIVKTDIL